MQFQFTDSFDSTQNVDLNKIPRDLLLLLLKQLPQKDFFTFRLICKAFKALVDNPAFIWEPKLLDQETIKTPIPFNLGWAQKDGKYYFAGARGEYRWPGGQLLLCREGDNVIEVKSLTLEKEGGIRCCHLTELVGHRSKITLLKPLSPKKFVSGDQTGRVMFWFETEKPAVFQSEELTQSEKPNHEAEISAITQSNKEYVLSADKSGNLKCWFKLSENNWMILKSIDLAKPIVSLKIVSNDEVEVICMNAEKKVFHRYIYRCPDLEKIRDESDIDFGVMLYQHTMIHFCSFFNGKMAEFRKDETDIGEGFGVARDITVSNIEKGADSESEFHYISAGFQISETADEIRENEVSVFSNGNMLFWRPNGDAKLICHKRLPLTNGKDLPQLEQESVASKAN